MGGVGHHHGGLGHLLDHPPSGARVAQLTDARLDGGIAFRLAQVLLQLLAAHAHLLHEALALPQPVDAGAEAQQDDHRQGESAQNAG